MNGGFFKHLKGFLNGDDVQFVFASSCFCGRAIVLFTLFVFASMWWCPRHIALLVLFCFSSPMLPISLDCTFLIAPLIFSNVFLNTKFSEINDIW